MKEASNYRDTDLERSIELLKKATELCPAREEVSFKLARYIRNAGRRDEAFSVYRKMIAKVSPHDVLFGNFSLEQIYGEMMKQLFEERKYSYYLYYYFQKLWCTLCGLAAQGNCPQIGKDIFFTFGPQTKVDKCLRELGRYEEKEEIGAIVYEVLKEHDPALRRLSEISDSLKFATSDDFEHHELSLGGRQALSLKSNSEFMTIFNRLSGPVVPDKLYNEKLKQYFSREARSAAT